MPGNLKKALINPLILCGIFLLGISVLVQNHEGHSYYLTAAQLVFVPALIHLIVPLRSFEKVIIAIGMVSVTLISLGMPFSVAVACSAVYLFYTFWVAWKGLERFLKRGFTNVPEILIDLGFMYLAIGGMWFFAHVSGIDTGFSEMLTWLTGIHFHYSAFMLCVSVGLLGRLNMKRVYKICALIIGTGPITVALGITFSTTIEIISVSLYVLAIYILTFYSFRITFPRGQALLVRIPYVTLCFTIAWSFLYAYGNFAGQAVVTIPTMLVVHGLLNCVLFGSFTVIGWALNVPDSTHQSPHFPVSRIRGKLKETGDPHRGLVDEMGNYVDKEKLPAEVVRFYEQTEQFKLSASVKWAPWFKPFAFIYKGISGKIGQINLPYSSQKVEMTGDILLVDEQLDSRSRPRVWHRRIGEETVFTAIYSSHQTAGQTYMNIALPLPFSTMHGILKLTAKNGKLHLTSAAEGDAGTYLAIGPYLPKLPLHERFVLQETCGKLTATHDMTIFGLHFLHIDYEIERREEAV
ncbi:YndJ family protein [Jeotgalibacillus aurantiacus]|uniref:YndJ family protein n=1 Tax=Jeotgalibacillus aurantiacus TaxID=2763266 RepID=UPI001D0B1A52|nr:YndJ family protein [Jeotgalibacillus aurantiacus]